VDGSDRHRPQIDFLAVECRTVAKYRGGACGHHQLGPGVTRQVQPSGHIVVVDVSLEDETSICPGLVEDHFEAIDVTLGVHDSRYTVMDEDVS
jgi:hypothetical protein